MSQQELQALVDGNYLSPQIRSFELIPLVNVQLYIETPELIIKNDGDSLAFNLKGSVDADFFGNAVTDRIPLRVSGISELKYVPEEHAFYFVELELKDALLDLELSLIQTLVMEQFRKALSHELMLIPLIPLKPDSTMYRRLSSHSYSVEVNKGVLKLERIRNKSEI